MCLHFGVVATNMMGKISLAKHFVFISVLQDQKCSSALPSEAVNLYNMGCLKGR